MSKRSMPFVMNCWSVDETCGSPAGFQVDIDGHREPSSRRCPRGVGEWGFFEDGKASTGPLVFWGRHARVPRNGVAVHINAFNFPAWGFAEKQCRHSCGNARDHQTRLEHLPATERCIEAIVDRCVAGWRAEPICVGIFQSPEWSRMWSRLPGPLILASYSLPEIFHPVRPRQYRSGQPQRGVPVMMEPGSETWNPMAGRARRSPRRVARSVPQCGESSFRTRAGMHSSNPSLKRCRAG